MPSSPRFLRRPYSFATDQFGTQLDPVGLGFKRSPDATRIQPADGRFPGATLEALKLLHLERKILMHGHEPLDADSTPSLVAEDWLMNEAKGVRERTAACHKPKGKLSFN